MPSDVPWLWLLEEGSLAGSTGSQREIWTPACKNNLHEYQQKKHFLFDSLIYLLEVCSGVWDLMISLKGLHSWFRKLDRGQPCVMPTQGDLQAFNTRTFIHLPYWIETICTCLPWIWFGLLSIIGLVKQGGVKGRVKHLRLYLFIGQVCEGLFENSGREVWVYQD